MGNFDFRWDHPADEVYVTGTFDDWAKSIKLEKVDSGFAKKVELPLGQKILYKFVVDGNWTTDPSAPQEDDGASNVNNILTPDRISNSENFSEPKSAMMSGVSADSTTAKLAGDVPKESSKNAQNVESTSSDLPGSFPQTPANEVSDFSVNPLPATTGSGNPIHLEPGEKVPDPSTLTSNTVSSTVKHDTSHSEADDSANTFGVAPLPATGGIGNPIHLEPGEKVPDPSTFTSNNINTFVTTDKESYEKGSNAPQLPDVVTPQTERDSKGASMFTVPGISNNMIPESSLPMGGTMPPGKDQEDPGFMIQSSGAGTTTAALAGQVPKEHTGVPQIVQESQKEAGQDAEAGGNREAVREKAEVEKELESKIPEAPPISEAPAVQDTGSDSAAGISTSSHGLPPSIQQSIDEMNKGSAIAPAVPDVVQESIVQSHVSPEAAGDKAMVGEKSAMEDELLKKVPTDNTSGQPAPIASAALAESAPAPTDTQNPASVTTNNERPGISSGMDNPPSAAAVAEENSTPVPSSVNATSTAAEPASSTPAPSTQSKGAKSFPTKSSAPSSAAVEPNSNASMTTAAAPAATPATQEAGQKSSDYSREVSPMTKTDHQSTPTITTGIGSAPVAQGSQATPSKIAASPTSGTSASTDKKSKRASGFFGKLKAKFSDKDKDKK